MEIDDLKSYSVIVGDGSGVLFQPMTTEYSYVLSAKHNFFNKVPVDGRPDKYEVKPDGSQIDIHILNKENNIRNSTRIKFQLKKGENYFPHETADVAILKIAYIKGYDKIHLNSHYSIEDNYYLCGFPKDKRDANQGNYISQYTNHKISNKIGSEDNLVTIRLNQEKTQNEISGMSGGGIFRITDNFIDLIGIQSQMSRTITQQNEIDFVPVIFLNQIVESNKKKLKCFLPPFMVNFQLLKDEILKLEGCIDDNLITRIRGKFLTKVDETLLTPSDIMNLEFKNQMLIHNEDSQVLKNKEIWVSWLEYLVVLQIVKDKIFEEADLVQIFNEIRLIHSDKNIDWFRIMPAIFKTELYGLNEHGILIVSTNKNPSRAIIEGETIIENIAQVNPVDSFKTDNAQIHPLKQFKFIHIKAFEKICENKQTELNQCDATNIQDLINKLKEIFNEVLQN